MKQQCLCGCEETLDSEGRGSARKYATDACRQKAYRRRQEKSDQRLLKDTRPSPEVLPLTGNGYRTLAIAIGIRAEWALAGWTQPIGDFDDFNGCDKASNAA